MFLGRTLLLLLMLALPASAQLPPLDFETPDPERVDRPAGWAVGGSGYEIELDTLAFQGAFSLRMRQTDILPNASGVASRTLPIDVFGAAPGGRLTLTGFIRTEGVTTRYAGLWLRVDDATGQSIVIDNMNANGATGTRDWTRFSASVVVPAAGARVVFGALMPGNGRAWFDDLAFEYEEPSVPLEGPRAVTEQGLDNLVAFTKLLGYVRHFHPTDEVLATEWDAFAVESLRPAEGAESPEELAAVLQALFRPIAPTLSVRVAVPDVEVARVEIPAGATHALTHLHMGLGGPNSNAYRSQVVRVPLTGGALPDSIVEMTRLPMVLPLGRGLEAVLPTVYARVDGTLPVGLGVGAPPNAPMSGDDRGVRIAAIATGWNVFRHFYPYFDVTPVDWEGALPGLLREAAESPNGCAFLHTLDRMMALLEDGHGSVTGPCLRPAAQPAVAVEWVEGGPTVTYVGDATPLLAGDAIRRIDGRPVEEVVAELNSLISSATPQWTESRLAGMLLAGPGGTSVELEVERVSGETVTVVATRNSNGVREPRGEMLRALEPGIWYVDLTRLTEAQFAAALPTLASAAGIVFEMRGYPTGAGRRALLHLIDDRGTSAQWHIPMVVVPDQVGLEFIQSPGWDLRPLDPHLGMPRVFLTDGSAISYAESVMGIVEAYDLGTIVGGPTAGTNGNVNPVQLPGGYTVVWTGMKVLKHDGSQHHRVGILPDVPAGRTRAGVAAGRDEVLERGVQLLREAANP